MSELNDSKSFTVYNGESYTLNLDAYDCYGIKAVNDVDGVNNLVIDGTIADGPLNGDCYTSITASVPASGTVSGNLEYNVISRPLQYQVIYHQTGETEETYDGGTYKIYTDFDNRPTTEVPRGRRKVNGITYDYSANCLSSLPSGWTEPTNYRFAGWSLSSEASEVDILPGDAFGEALGDCSIVDSSTYVLDLYACYVEEDAYEATINFDNVENDGGSIE